MELRPCASMWRLHHLEAIRKNSSHCPRLSINLRRGHRRICRVIRHFSSRITVPSHPWIRSRRRPNGKRQANPPHLGHRLNSNGSSGGSKSCRSLWPFTVGTWWKQRHDRYRISRSRRRPTIHHLWFGRHRGSKMYHHPKGLRPSFDF